MEGGGEEAGHHLRSYEGLSIGWGTEDLWWGHKDAEILVDQNALGMFFHYAFFFWTKEFFRGGGQARASPYHCHLEI